MSGTDHELIDLALRLPREVLEAMVLDANQRVGDQAKRRVALAKWILTSRKRRRSMLPCMRFGEPTWEMILDLYIADAEGRRIDTSSLCLASGVAPTTALRYVDLLADDGLIGRTDDCRDGRRALIDMSAVLRSAIEVWLDRADAGLFVAGLSANPAVTSKQLGDCGSKHDDTLVAKDRG